MTPVKVFPVWHRIRLISVGLEPVLTHKEKSCSASYYRQFIHEYQNKIIKLIPALLAKAFRPSGLTKLG